MKSLQTQARSTAACKNIQKKIEDGRKTFHRHIAMLLLTVGCTMAGTYANAQLTPPLERAASVNVAGINVEGSPAVDAVNFRGSSQGPNVYYLGPAPAPPAIDADLPDAPSAMLQEKPLHAAKVESDDSQTRAVAPHVAPIHTKFIPAGWEAQPLTPHDKVILGARNLYAPFSIAGYVLSAGYSHLTNGQPNYGVNSAAFAKRLGAAVVRDTTEGAFTDMIFAPLLREDPRYYVEGRKHSYVHRVLYALTRPLITRTDSGHETLNGALLIGQASASALSYVYYPSINRNFRDTFATFGGSLSGSALDDVISEFSGQFLKELHLRKSSAMPR